MNLNTREFKGILAVEMADFLRHQRALGKRFLGEERGLRLFDQYLVDQKVGAVAEITPELVDAFLVSRPRTRPRSYNHLLSVVDACSNGWSDRGAGSNRRFRADHAMRPRAR